MWQRLRDRLRQSEEKYKGLPEDKLETEEKLLTARLARLLFRKHPPKIPAK